MEAKTFYRGNLPHFIPNDRPYFLTFRLAGSLPIDREKLGVLSARGDFLAYDRELDTRRDGPHHLRDASIATIVQDAIHYRDGREYELIAHTIMSNHVHMAIRLSADRSLPAVMQSLKAWTARLCNQALDRTGDFWQHEGYDHVIREGKLGYTIEYIIMNPVKAGIVEHWWEHPFTYLQPGIEGFDRGPGRVVKG